MKIKSMAYMVDKDEYENIDEDIKEALERKDTSGLDLISLVRINTKQGKKDCLHFIDYMKELHILMVNDKKLETAVVLKYAGPLGNIESVVKTKPKFESLGYTSAFYCYLVEWSPAKSIVSDIVHYNGARRLWLSLSKCGVISIMKDYKIVEYDIKLSGVNDPKIWTERDTEIGEKLLHFQKLNSVGRSKFEIIRKF